MFLWELPDERVKYRDKTTGQERDFPKTINRRFNASMGGGKKPTLTRTFIESWRGVQFTEEERKGFDVHTMIGRNGLITVTHKPTSSGVYANVSSISPLLKHMTPRQGELVALSVDLDPLREGKEMQLHDSIPEWIRREVESSSEWTAKYGTNKAPGNNGMPDDDDIPF